MSAPGIELPTSCSLGKRSPHCATYAPDIHRGTFSYLIKYSRLKCPKHPFFQVQWLTATLIYLQRSFFVCSISFICSIHLLFAMLVFICSILFFYLQRTFFICSVLFYLQSTFFICSVLFYLQSTFFYLQRFFFVCSVLFLFAAYIFYLQRSFFVCSVSFSFAAYFFICSVPFLFAAFLFCLQRFFFVCSVSLVGHRTLPLEVNLNVYHFEDTCTLSWYDLSSPSKIVGCGWACSMFINGLAKL